MVEVHTDEGIVGIGSGGVPVRWEVAGLFLVGQDPFNIEQHVYNLRSMAFFVGRPWPVEIALWDIIGKATGQPVYKLLGGGSDKLRAYASTGELRPTEARVEAAQQIVAEGFRAIKLRFHSPDWRDDVKTLEAVRKAVGDKVDIMVDGNWGWRIAAGAASPPLGPEDGDRGREGDGGVRRLLAGGAAGRVRLRRPRGAASHLTTLRLAGGELNRGPEEIKTYLEKGCFDVYQPDCTFIGGISTTRKIAAMVEADGKVFTPHTWTNGIGVVANLHCAAASSRVPYIEFPYDPPNWMPEHRDFIFKEPHWDRCRGLRALADRARAGHRAGRGEAGEVRAEATRGG